MHCLHASTPDPRSWNSIPFLFLAAEGVGHTINFGSYSDLHYGRDPLEIVIDKKVVFQGRLQLDPAALGESLRTETDYARLCGVKLTFDIFDIQAR
jgi:hypothetical protein